MHSLSAALSALAILAPLLPPASTALLHLVSKRAGLSCTAQAKQRLASSQPDDVQAWRWAHTWGRQVNHLSD